MRCRITSTWPSVVTLFFSRLWPCVCRVDTGPNSIEDAWDLCPRSDVISTINWLTITALVAVNCLFLRLQLVYLAADEKLMIPWFSLDEIVLGLHIGWQVVGSWKVSTYILVLVLIHCLLSALWSSTLMSRMGCLKNQLIWKLVLLP